MEYKNIVTKRVYEYNGSEKTKWSVVGVLKTNDNGKQFIDLGMFPDTTFYCFDQKAKEEGTHAQGNTEDVDLG